MIYQDRIETGCLKLVLLFFKSTLLLNCSKHNWQALTRLRHQERRRVYREENKLFKLCPTHSFREGQIFFSGETKPAATLLLTGLIIGNDFFVFYKFPLPSTFFLLPPPVLPAFRRP